MTDALPKEPTTVFWVCEEPSPGITPEPLDCFRPATVEDVTEAMVLTAMHAWDEEVSTLLGDNVRLQKRMAKAALEAVFRGD